FNVRCATLPSLLHVQRGVRQRGRVRSRGSARHGRVSAASSTYGYLTRSGRIALAIFFLRRVSKRQRRCQYDAATSKSSAPATSSTTGFVAARQSLSLPSAMYAAITLVIPDHQQEGWPCLIQPLLSPSSMRQVESFRR